jgi:hypothetical protein
LLKIHDCVVKHFSDSDGKVGVFFDLDFLKSDQTDNEKTIEEIIIKKSGRLVKDEKLFLVIQDFLVYVKNIKITLETVYVSGDVNFPDRSIYTKGNTSKLKVERIHWITGNIQERGFELLMFGIEFSEKDIFIIIFIYPVIYIIFVLDKTVSKLKAGTAYVSICQSFIVHLKTNQFSSD